MFHIVIWGTNLSANKKAVTTETQNTSTQIYHQKFANGVSMACMCGIIIIFSTMLFIFLSLLSLRIPSQGEKSCHFVCQSLSYSFMTGFTILHPPLDFVCYFKICNLVVDFNLKVLGLFFLCCLFFGEEMGVQPIFFILCLFWYGLFFGINRKPYEIP